jgi:hypothetical protein
MQKLYTISKKYYEYFHVLYTSHRIKTIVPYTALSKMFLCNKDTGRFLLEGELLNILLIR